MGFLAARQHTDLAAAQERLTRYMARHTVTHYDLGTGYQVGPPNGLVDDDVRRTWWLRSRISAKQRPQWLALDTLAGPLWAALPMSAALDDPDQISYAMNRDAAFELFTHFYGKDRRIARVAKVLHPKRSQFVALLDSHVMNLFRPVLAKLPMDPLDHVPLLWDAIRLDLLLPQNRQALAALRRWLHAHIHDQPGYAAFLQLSDLRLFDIVACW